MNFGKSFHYKVYDAFVEKIVIAEGNYYSELIDLDIHDINAIKGEILEDYSSICYVIFIGVKNAATHLME